MQDFKKAEAFNIIAFLLNNNILNENGSLIEFGDHNFLVDPYLDNTPRQVIRKAAQVGWSTLAILRSFHLARYAGANIIHTFPSRNMSKDFVVPKVDPLISRNPIIRDMVGKDSVSLKQVGDRFIYYRGSYEQQEAISISAHILINDEYDRCFPVKAVEVLTKSGWKLIEDVTKNDYVLTRHPKTHLSSFKKPSKIIKQNYNGDIYTLKGRGINIPATKNHKFLVQTDSKKQILETISEIYDKPFSVINTVKWHNDYRKTASIPRIDTKRNLRFKRQVAPLIFPTKKVNAEAWFEFLGWYLSEGCIAKAKVRYGKRATGQVVISQKNKENISLIIDCIKRLGFNPKTYRYNNSVTQISFSDLHLALYLQKLGDVYKKYIPSRWLWADPKLCKKMLESLMRGDGDERGVYTTVSKKLADGVQTLILRTGDSANIYRSEDMYKVGTVKTPYRRFNKKSGSSTKAFVKKGRYKGKISCIEIPNHTILVRKAGGGLPIWSGNSNQMVLKTYRSRLDDAKRERPELGWEWQFSNPSIPGYGVDFLWQKSDQKHWFVTCPGCKHDQYLNFPENINFETKKKICSKCHNELPVKAIIGGRWVKKFNDPEISGYWISQMMMPWISASKIIEDSEGDQDIFHNFTLGLPYISKDTSVSRETIIGCLSPGSNPRTNVAIGVDNGIKKHYVIGNRYGIFDIGVTESWQAIEDLRNQYSATMVIDALPYPNTPQQLANKYAGKTFIHYYQPDRKKIGTIRWDGQVVRSDRTKVIDALVGELNSKDIGFNFTEQSLEEYIYHWAQFYRIIKQTPQGVKKPHWQTIEGRPDHFAHATVYWRIALEQTLGQGGIVRAPGPTSKKGQHPVVSPDSTVSALNLKDVIKRAMNKRRRR